MASPLEGGNPEYYDRWMAEKAMREADAANRYAQAAAINQYELDNPLPSGEVVIAGEPAAANVDPLSGMYVDPSAPPATFNGGVVSAREAALAAFDDAGNRAAQAEASRRQMSPYDVASAVGMGGVDATSNAYGAAQAVATAPRTVVTRDNPMYQPVRAYTGASRIGDAQIQQAVGQGQAIEQEQANALAGYLVDERARIAAATTAQMEAEQERARQAIAMERRSKAIQMEVDRAADKFSKAPDEDKGRFWASRSGWQKFALVLSAAAKGWLQGQGYNIDPMAQINDAIRMDIEEQRSNRALLGEKLSARKQQANEARASYAQMLEQFGDERLAENMLETARLKEAQARLASMTAGFEAEKLGPAHQKFMADLNNEIAKKELERRTLEIKTPPKISKVIQSPNVQIVGPDGKTYIVPRAFAMQQAAAGAQHGRALQMKGVDVASEGAKSEADIAGKMAIEQAKGQKPDAAERRVAMGAKQWVIDKTADIREELHQLKQWRDKYSDEIPGFTAGYGWDFFRRGDEPYESLFRAVRKRLRRESGAAIPESEIRDEAGASLRAYGTEDEVRADVDRRIEEAERLIDYYERAPEEDLIKEINRSDVGPRAPLTSGGVGLPDAVSWDEE